MTKSLGALYHRAFMVSDMASWVKRELVRCGRERLILLRRHGDVCTR